MVLVSNSLNEYLIHINSDLDKKYKKNFNNFDKKKTQNKPIKCFFYQL